MKPKLISVCMALCLVLSLVPAAAVEPKTAADILPAPLHDTSNTIKDDTDLYESYQVSGAVKDGKVQVTITATGLQEHQNGDTPATRGYWVGFFVKAPEDADSLKGSWGETIPDSTQPVVKKDFDKITSEGSEVIGWSIYVNAGNRIAEKSCYTLQWLKDNKPLSTITYSIDTSGVLWAPPEVQTAPLHDTTAGDGHIADGELYTGSYTATPSWDQEAVKISLAAANLKKHQNGVGTQGYWVGFFAEAPGGAETLAAGKSADNLTAYTKDQWDTVNDKQGWAVYVDAEKNNVSPVTYIIQWKDANGAAISTTTYRIDTSGVKFYTPPPATLTITFNPNGGSLAQNEQTQTISNPGTLSALPEPTRSGYDFAGWFTQAEGGEIYAAGVDGKYHFSADTTLYAHWTEKAKPAPYTITFDPNGGTLADSTKTTAETDQDGKLADSSFPANPSWEGYTFKGWYRTKDSNADTDLISTGTVFKADSTVYAQWTSNTETPETGYTITFNANGGAFGSASTAEKTTDASGKLTDFPNEPTYAGHTFAGWFDSQTGGNQVTKTENNTFTGNATLYARWTENQSSTPGVHTIIFRDNYDDSWYDTITTDSNGRVSEFPAHGSHRNYTFDGWFDNDTGYEVTESTVFTRDTVVYAYWYYNRSSDRGYISNGGSSGTSSASVPVTTIPGITVSHGTASIASTDAGRAGSSTYLGIANLTAFDVSPLGGFISTVKIPTGVLREIANSSRGLYVKLGTGEAALDSAAVLTLANLGGGEVAITVKPASITTLTPRQRATAGSAPIFDVTITCGGRPVTNLGGGSVTASIPYTLPAGQNQYGLTVFYLTPTGQRLLCSTTYDTAGRSVTFSTRNLSKFMIG